MRVLLVGERPFREGLLESLGNAATDVIGYADTIEQGVLMTDWLRPDVVVLEAHLAGDAKRIAMWSPVVALAPAASSSGGPNQDCEATVNGERAVLQLALALACVDGAVEASASSA